MRRSGYGTGIYGITDWITPVIVVAVSGLSWRHLVEIENRFDRVDSQLDDMADETAASGQAITIKVSVKVIL